MNELVGGLYLAGCIIVVLAIFQYNKLAAVVFTVAFLVIFRPSQTVPALPQSAIATPVPRMAQAAPRVTTVAVQIRTEGVRPQPTTIAVQVVSQEQAPQAQSIQVSYSNESSKSNKCCLWPVPTHLGVTQQPRAGHTALDIGAATGKPVIAAAAGRVITRGWSNVGYGKHMILDHGNGLHTLYAHFSEYIASQGQYVEAGQTIGLIGSTGKSTGPHLHFEVRVNGVLKNPWNYLKK